MFRAKMRHWSTPLVIGASVVVGISGVLMFFHLAEGLVKLMHEWLGMLFVIATLFHIFNHWGPFKRYFSEKIAAVVMVFVLVVAAGFIYSSATGERKGHPAKQVIDLVMNAPLTTVAALTNKPASQLVDELKGKGITVTDTQQTLSQLAKSNQQNPFALFAIVTDDVSPPENMSKQ